jgi:hypothetical protein
MRWPKLFERLGIAITRNDTEFIGFGLISRSPASGHLPYDYPGLSPVDPWALDMMMRQDIFPLLEIKTDLLG